jgi:cytochrome oxidase Cu insertion factor (SCO1/SenC/PrrC family)
MKIFSERLRPRPARTRILAALLATALLAAGCASATAPAHHSTGTNALSANPVVDPGSSLGNKPAPDFTLQNQFGQHVTLSQFHGKAVLLAFVDSHCTTVCSARRARTSS